MNQPKYEQMVFGSFEHDGEKLEVHQTQYGNGNLAIRIMTEHGEAWGNLSVNTGVEMGDHEFVVNHDMTALGWDVFAFQSGLFVDTGKRADYGMVTDQPVWAVKEPWTEKRYDKMKHAVEGALHFMRGRPELLNAIDAFAYGLDAQMAAVTNETIEDKYANGLISSSEYAGFRFGQAVEVLLATKAYEAKGSAKAKAKAVKK